MPFINKWNSPVLTYKYKRKHQTKKVIQLNLIVLQGMEAKGQKTNAVSHPEHLLLIKAGHKAAKYIYTQGFVFIKLCLSLNRFRRHLKLRMRPMVTRAVELATAHISVTLSLSACKINTLPSSLFHS